MRGISLVASLVLLCLSGAGEAADARRLSGRADYDEIKSVVIKQLVRLGRTLSNEQPDQQSGAIELNTCTGLADEWAVSDAVSDLVEIAGISIDWAGTYNEYGYPENAYKPAITRAEDALLERSKQRPLLEFDDFVEFLEGQARNVVNTAGRWRTQHDKKLPRIIFGQGCGAGGPLPVKFESKPPGGRIFVISEFEFELCISRGSDPTDHQKCRFWRLADNEEWVSGWTYVQGEWPQGKSEPARRDFDHVQPHQTITVEYP
ncbi:hypothetical protein G6M16_006155 [Agrobacterium tumefaciens]|nr:hypothetical protein G6M16_006155 [Agrobacterium tumefaciens]